MSLRRFGYTFRDVDLFLTTIGTMTAKTCQKWTNILVHHDFDDFIADGRGHDESTYKSGEICAKRWIIEDNAPFYNKGRGRSIMASDFLVMHSSASFFSLNCNEFKEALEKYPDLNNDSDIIYEERTASATLNIGGNSYFNNEIILKQIERLFQLLRFKEDYKDHDFVCLVDNARTHTAAEYTVDPGGRCPVSTIEYVDHQNVRRIINCYDHDGKSKGLLKLANELNLHIPRRCKLPELKMIMSEHPAFKHQTRKVGSQIWS
ncbi:unnamed protein product [Didymodactylos carnosus]|uniref:Uncharacterized protein n=1 Tax=Didymodactylos carnosus TaxID=1234261 RepID=A0A815YWD0_9BILA|nr:unnamed protein product [Didymodactylos carnosus]CAF4441873.1 unnamed protein product [Didymodactylos carnosus]